MSEYKDRWIAALRSGEYTQGRHRLCVDDGDGDGRAYCCLGVLAEMDGKLEHAGEEYGTEGEVIYGVFVRSDDNREGMDASMYWGREDYLLNVRVPDPIGPPRRYSALASVVARMNDRGSTFEQIADYLEGVDF